MLDYKDDVIINTRNPKMLILLLLMMLNWKADVNYDRQNVYWFVR